MNSTHRSGPEATDESRPIVCAIDDDALAVRVLQTAVALAQRLQAPLRVVHSAYPDTFVAGETYRAVMHTGRAFVERITDGITVDEFVVELGAPARLITDVADEGAAMIVLGNRGRGPLKAMLRGSVSSAVIAKASCPVVAVAATAVPVVLPRAGHPAAAEAA